MSVDTSLGTNGDIFEKEKKSALLLSLTEVRWHFPAIHCNVRRAGKKDKAGFKVCIYVSCIAMFFAKYEK